MGWQWHQLDHTKIICISLQTDNHATTSSLNFFTGRILFLMPNQQCQSTEGIQTIAGLKFNKEQCSKEVAIITTTTVLWPLFRDHPGEPVPEKNFWTLWCKGRLTEVDTLTIQLDATPSRLTSAHLHYPPIFVTGWMPFLPPNQQCQSTEGN